MFERHGMNKNGRGKRREERFGGCKGGFGGRGRGRGTGRGEEWTECRRNGSGRVYGRGAPERLRRHTPSLDDRFGATGAGGRDFAPVAAERVPEAESLRSAAPGFCPLCDNHCPASAPACPKGEAYILGFGDGSGSVR